jgi:hypothetical protein
MLKIAIALVLSIGAATAIGAVLVLLFGFVGVDTHESHENRERREREESDKKYKEDRDRVINKLWKEQNALFKKKQAEGHKGRGRKKLSDKLGRLDWQGYKEHLRDDRSGVRVWAAEALGQIGGRLLIVTAREIVDPLGKRLQDSETDRQGFMEAAAKEGFKERAAEIADQIEAALKGASKDSEESVRRAATQALAKLKQSRTLLDHFDLKRPGP